MTNAKNLENFIDDVIAHSDGFENQLKTLRELFECVKRANLKIKPSKQEFATLKLNF